MHHDRCNTSHNPLHANYSHPSGVKLVAPVSLQQGSVWGLMYEGGAVPTVIINSGSTGHRVGAVNFKSASWLSSLNQNVDYTG